ncbi:hypothetical protein DPMN_181878 [Dreissena polymorpha]|uniref:Uncharacterized protein n=1 Tax=Dreissena polymorpha TaxID=45954 RepID=A0A9D4DEJ2_DREPO|nr:hypothetical protein DPMN_181878 [Dreissena polymorpha]
MLKLAQTDQPTDQPTDQQTNQQTGQKQYVPHYYRLTRFYYIRKNAPPLGSHFFQANIIIFVLIQDIIETNLLTKFHEDWTIIVASRELTRKNAPPLLIQDIIGTNLLTKFHDDRKINVISRVLTRKIAPWWPYIIGINLLTEFHIDRTINVASRCHLRKNAPPLDSHVCQANVTIFELIQDIIETNLLTKFHEDWTINVASRELTRQMTGKKRSQKLTMSTLCSGELKTLTNTNDI